MITNKEQLFSMLKNSKLAYQLFDHPAVFTVEQAMQYCSHIPGSHVKNLFLRNKKKTFYCLITLKEEKRVDLSELGDLLELGRLSFASNEDLINILGVQPGSVTPVAIINDNAKRVKLFFDEDLLKNEEINIHPLENIATISMGLNDLLQFIENENQKKITFIKIPTTSL